MQPAHGTNRKQTFQVIDLFAGPGGLAEGFSSLTDGKGHRLFDVVLSAEKDEAAHRTLTLRAFVRQFDPGTLPADYYLFCKQQISLEELAKRHAAKWASAEQEAMLVELGTPAGNRIIDQRLDVLLAGEPDRGRAFVVIGGPPCQAYSLVGRARNAGIKGYRPHKDHRHFLYREYIRILARVGPAAFVMENVKGILSSAIGGDRIIEKILEDLEQPDSGPHRYRLMALTSGSGVERSLLSLPTPQDFVVRAEQHGIPQARHRVIIVGVREDLFPAVGPVTYADGLLPPSSGTRTVSDVIGRLPKLRSGLSRGDGEDEWRLAFRKAIAAVVKATSARSASAIHEQIAARAQKLLDGGDDARIMARSSFRYRTRETNDELMTFLQDPQLTVLPNHETRGHMEGDLARYLYCALFGEISGRSPKASEFPSSLAPAHANWNSGKFADRFRVQVAGNPSTTVTSHISKDGHYFIHPDPAQCRSLTVREAARLQTFPDNYVFLGNRTEQFVQVGNAVPPFLARQIATALGKVLASADASSVRDPARSHPATTSTRQSFAH